MESTPILLKPKGFTLVEMLVVIAIITILTAVVINGQTGFNKSLTITDSAYTVALSLREAQTFGLSSRTFGGSSNAGYGAHFTSAANKGYLLFADIQNGSQPAWCPATHTGQVDDKPGNCLYDSSTETVQTFSFGRGFYISKLCGHDFQQPGVLRCSTDAINPLTSVDTVFIRPNTDSIITGTATGIGSIQLVDASIVISEPTGVGSRVICLSYAGQISVASTVCP